MFPTLHERERERESSWTAVRAQPDECACCVVPSSILGRTDRVTAPCVLWAWAASLRPGRGRTRREVRRRSRTVRARASLRRPGTLGVSYAIGPWSPGTGILVSDNFQSCRVERKEPHDLEAPSWARTGSTHHPCGGGLTGCRHVVPRMREASRQMLLTGVTPPRRSRVRAAAAVAAANSGPIGTHGLQSGVKSGEEMHRSTQAQKIGRWTAPPVFSHILPFNGLCLYGSCRPHLRP